MLWSVTQTLVFEEWLSKNIQRSIFWYTGKAKIITSISSSKRKWRHIFKGINGRGCASRMSSRAEGYGPASACPPPVFRGKTLAEE